MDKHIVGKLCGRFLIVKITVHQVGSIFVEMIVHKDFVILA